MIFWEVKQSNHKVILSPANPVRKNIKLILVTSVTYGPGYERQVQNAQISDHAIADILKTALSELGSDLCYPITIRSEWTAYQITQNEDLNVKVKGNIWKISNYIKC